MSMSIYVRSKSPQNIGFPPHVEQVSMLTNKGRIRKPRGRREEEMEIPGEHTPSSTRPHRKRPAEAKALCIVARRTVGRGRCSCSPPDRSTSRPSRCSWRLSASFFLGQKCNHTAQQLRSRTWNWCSILSRAAV